MGNRCQDRRKRCHWNLQSQGPREIRYLAAANLWVQDRLRARDFLLEKTAESTEENPAVGLWAKPYMTSEKYEFLGTLLTRKSFQCVAQGKQPPMQKRDISDSKTEHEDKVVQKLDAVLRIPRPKFVLHTFHPPPANYIQHHMRTTSMLVVII